MERKGLASTAAPPVPSASAAAVSVTAPSSSLLTAASDEATPFIRRATVSALPIDVAEVTAAVADPRAGATATFLGTTRNSFEGRGVVRLEYTAYAKMAEKQLRSIASAARARWPELTAIAMQHRTGAVPVCGASVMVAVSSPHRRSALKAAEFAIDEIKARLTVWKLEVYDDGSQLDERGGGGEGGVEARAERRRVNGCRGVVSYDGAGGGTSASNSASTNNAQIQVEVEDVAKGVKIEGTNVPGKGHERAAWKRNKEANMLYKPGTDLV